jgi:hypothetical protein
MADKKENEYKELSSVLKDFHRSEEYTTSYFNRAKTHYKNYRLYRTKSDFPYANSVFTPDTFAYVEDAAARITQTLFSKEPVFIVSGRDKMADMGIAAQLTEALSYFTGNSDFELFAEALDFFKAGAMLGTSYLGVYPDFEEDPNGMLMYRGPRFENIDYWDGYPDSKAKRINKFARFFVRRKVIYSEELQALADQGYYDKSAVSRIIDGSFGEMMNTYHRDLLAEIGLSQYTSEDPNKHEILEWYGNGQVVCVGDRKEIIKDTRRMNTIALPYAIPIVDYRYVSIPGEFYGIGIPEVIRDLQADKNIIRSQRRENVDLILNKILKVKTGATDVDIDMLKYFPGAVWMVGDHADIQEHDMRDVTSSAYKEEEVITWDMDNATAQWMYSRGAQPQREETATGIIRLQQASLARFDVNIKLTEFSSMRSIAKMIILQMRRFLPQQEYERILGEPDRGFYQISEHDLVKMYDFVPVGSSITNIKELRATQVMKAQEMLFSVPPQVQQMEGFKINYRNVLEMGLKEALDIRDVGNLIQDAPPPPPPNPFMQGGPQGMVNMPPDLLLKQAMAKAGGPQKPVRGMEGVNTPPPQM